MCISKNGFRNRTGAATSAAMENESDLLITLDSLWESREDKENKDCKHAHYTIEHDYHDHANEMYQKVPEPVAKGGVTTPFPVKLHEVLESIEEDGLADVISWQPHGRCFVVHKPKEFVAHVMPTYFKQTKFASFQRQLNLYGFNRLTRGSDKGGYYHEMFLRGMVFLSHRISRIKVKGTGVRARSNPSSEPNFYTMPPVTVTKYNDSPPAPYNTLSSSMSPMEEASLEPYPMDAPSAYFATSETKRPQDQLWGDDWDDVVCFEGRSFHYLDPFQKLEGEKQSDYVASSHVVVSDDEEPVSSEDIDALLESLNCSRNLSADIAESIDDDVAFRNMLERLIQSI